MSDRLSGLDVTYLTYDAGPMPMNAGGVVVLDPRPDGSGLGANRLTALLGERLHLLRRYRQVATRAGLDRHWVWADSPAFDLDRHVVHHRLPFPGGLAQLTELVTRIHTRRLDPVHPLWEAHAVEGLAGGRSALVMRWQHAMVDGMSGIEVARMLFDTSPHQVAPSAGRRTPTSAGARAGVAPAGAAAGPSGDVVDDLDRATAFLDGWIAQLEATQGRRWFREASGVVRLGFGAVPDAALRSVTRSSGVGLDVVFLTVVAAGVADVLAARGGGTASDDTIRTVVPMAIPTRDRREVLGNHASYYVVALPIGPMRVDGRLAAVAEAVERARPTEQVGTIATMLRGLDRMPDWLVATASRAVSGSGSVDLLATYMRGPRRPLWLAGLPHVSTHPLMPLGPFVRVMVGAANLGGDVGLSVTADEAALPEVDFLLDRMRRAAADLARRAPVERAGAVSLGVAGRPRDPRPAGGRRRR